jgi:hypothetical protein
VRDKRFLFHLITLLTRLIVGHLDGRAVTIQLGIVAGGGGVLTSDFHFLGALIVPAFSQWNLEGTITITAVFLNNEK